MTYPLGTDAIGRDILSRLMYGARLSLSIGVAVVALSIVVGTCLGMAAAFFRGVTEIAIMRTMDVLLSLPSLLLAIVIVAILGPGLMNAMLAVAIVVLPHYVRTARAAAMTSGPAVPSTGRRPLLSTSGRRWASTIASAATRKAMPTTNGVRRGYWRNRRLAPAKAAALWPDGNE